MSLSASLEIKVRILKFEVLETYIYGFVTWYPDTGQYDELYTRRHRLPPCSIGLLGEELARRAVK